VIAVLREALEQERRFRIEQLAQPGTTPAAQGDALGEVHAIVMAGARRALADIDAALEAMREGRYGRCDACHGPIPWRVLRAVPRTRLCCACRPAEDGAGTARDPG
jgi:RNA polymerase-binding transcription factor DksA